MKNFLKKNWFEIGVLIIGILIVVALFNGGDINLVPNNTDSNQQASLSEAALDNQQQEDKESDNKEEYYEVSRIIDGDTVILEKNGEKETVRLIGIDSPEKDQCFYEESKKRIKELTSDKLIKIENDLTQDERDIYNRLLGYLYTKDGQFINKQMVSEGYAREYTYKKPYIYQGEFLSSEGGAKRQALGVWKPGVCDGLWSN